MNSGINHKSALWWALSYMLLGAALGGGGLRLPWFCFALSTLADKGLERARLPSRRTVLGLASYNVSLIIWSPKLIFHFASIAIQAVINAMRARMILPTTTLSPAISRRVCAKAGRTGSSFSAICPALSPF